MDSVTFVATRRNGRALCFGGFFYHINKSVDERSYWKCRTKGCKATVVTIHDVISSSSGQHQHEPNDARVLTTADDTRMLAITDSNHSIDIKPKVSILAKSQKKLIPISQKVKNIEIISNNCNKKLKLNNVKNSNNNNNNNNNRNSIHNYVEYEYNNSNNNGFSYINESMSCSEEAMNSFVDHLNVEIEVDESGTVELEDIDDHYDNTDNNELLAECSAQNSMQLVPAQEAIKPNSIYFTNNYTNIEHFDIEINNLFEVVRQSGFNSLDIQQISNDWELWKRRYLELKRARSRAKHSTSNGCNDRDIESLRLQLEIVANEKANADRELRRLQNNLRESQNNVLALRSVLKKNLLNGSNNQCIALVNEINELKRKVSAQVENHQSNLNEVKRLLCLDDNDQRTEFDQLAQERDEALKDNLQLRQQIIILKSQLSSCEDKSD